MQKGKGGPSIEGWRKVDDWADEERGWGDGELRNSRNGRGEENAKMMNGRRGAQENNIHNTINNKNMGSREEVGIWPSREGRT
jgi:hypothetical protein